MRVVAPFVAISAVVSVFSLPFSSHSASTSARRLQLSSNDDSDGAVYTTTPLRGNGDNSVLAIQIAGGTSKALQHSDALFGTPAYGGGRTGRLYYPASHDPSGCNAANLTSDPDIPPMSIFLLDRGGCQFTAKVAAAQAAGAIGVVVVDNLGLCGRSPECGREACSRCPLYSTPQCQCTLPYLGDDSGGGGISIPSMMIGREDGEELRAPASVGKSGPPHVLVSMKWDMPAPDDKVSFALWHSPNDPMTFKFRQSITPYLPYILPQTDFLPHPYIFDGRALGCSGDSPVFDCKGQCTNNGYYCAIDPDGDLDQGISGADVVRESVRSICVAQQAVKQGDGGLQWWAYSDAFQAQCNTPATWTEECSYRVMTGAGIDAGKARECYAAANATVNPVTGDFTNILLQQEVNVKADMGIVTLPTIMVNDILLRGSNSASGVLSAICAGYAAGTAPAVCGCLGVPLDGLASCVATASGQSTPTPAGGLPSWAGVLIAFCVIGVLIALGMSYHHHKQQKRMSGEMVDLMDDYRALVDEGGASVEDTGARAGVAGGKVPGHARRVSRDRLRAGRTDAASGHGAATTAPGAVGWMSEALTRIMAPPAPTQPNFPTSASGAPGQHNVV